MVFSCSSVCVSRCCCCVALLCCVIGCVFFMLLVYVPNIAEIKFCNTIVGDEDNIFFHQLLLLLVFVGVGVAVVGCSSSGLLACN